MESNLDQLRDQWARAAVLGQAIIVVDHEAGKIVDTESGQAIAFFDDPHLVDVGQRYDYSRNPDAVDPRPVTLEQIVKVLREIAFWLDRRGYASIGRTVACPHPCMMPGRNRYLNMRLDFCDSCLKILFPPPKDEDT